MAKILTGGLGRSEVADTLAALGLDGLEVALSNDMDGATKLRSGLADYYLGTCLTGAGASLGLLVGLLGQPLCHTFGRSVPTEEQVGALLADGKRVFGFAADRIDAVAPVVARAIVAHG
ncbi:DUF2620 family protein [Streptomyces sp. NPDC087850]|uniref:DUF2620 family protein n=1 Tax=Streptomyces sp. NPDC087850 TaxID=3365809 RepID=UPI0037F68DA8